MNVYETICDILKENLCLEDDFDFSENLTFAELGTDSLDMVEIVMETEDKFDIQIDDEDLIKVKNLGELTELVESLI